MTLHCTDLEVLNFYKEMPFNLRDSVESQAAAITRRNLVAEYPVLPPLLRPGVRVLEVGCGAGWLSNSIAFYYKNDVLGLDFNPAAIERAAAVAEALGLKTQFKVQDLFSYRPPQPFPVVVSLGVLHHTHDCQGALKLICEAWVADQGAVVAGLYHRYGRRPFLDYFADLKAQGRSQAELFAAYAALNPHIQDHTLLQSWFRDQVLHPHETQHDFAEILEVFEACGFQVYATSLNRFQPIASYGDIIRLEKTYLARGQEMLRQQKYFPGFFIVAAQKVKP
jgi:SAM-dependent methyltransferase